jgi:predicted DNA-binding protein
LLLHLIKNDFSNVENITLLDELYKKLNKINNNSSIEKINIVVEQLYYFVNDVNKFYNIVKLLSNKIKKNPNIKIKINNTSEEMLDKLSESPDKFISWFIK